MPRYSDEITDSWLSILEPITLEEFCDRWVPIIYNLRSGEKKEQRKASVDLLVRLTKLSKKTVQNWFSGTQPCPDDILRLLGVVDRLWQVRCQVFPNFRNK
jgi:hypothetical protein